MVDAASVLNALKFWQGYERELTTLAMYAVGMAVYCLLVFAFYQSLSMRNLFGLGTPTRGLWRNVWRGARFLTLFPIMSFLFFLVLSVSLFFLAKSESQTVEQILLVSMSVVVGVRATAYVSEGAATDLAKLVPLGLLGVMLVDPGYLSIGIVVERFQGLFALRDVVLRYFLVLVLLEVTLRLLYVLWRKLTGEDEVIPPPRAKKDVVPVTVQKR